MRVPPRSGTLALAGCSNSPSAGLLDCPIGGGVLTFMGGSNYYGVSGVSVSGGTGGPVTCGSISNTGATVLSCTIGSVSQGISGAWNVVVSANGGTSGSSGYNITYAGAPTIGTLALAGCSNSPSAGLLDCPIGGGVLTFNGGSNYYGVSGVSVSGGTGGPVTCGSISNTGATVLSCTIGSVSQGISGTWNVVVSANGGTSGSSGYNITYAGAPTIGTLALAGCSNSPSEVCLIVRLVVVC